MTPSPHSLAFWGTYLHIFRIFEKWPFLPFLSYLAFSHFCAPYEGPITLSFMSNVFSIKTAHSDWVWAHSEIKWGRGGVRLEKLTRMPVVGFPFKFSVKLTTYLITTWSLGAIVSEINDTLKYWAVLGCIYSQNLLQTNYTTGMPV